ncbi:MAG: hypothetical protein ABIJ27_07930 [Candidatus Omnitrophota bacterium]
MGIVKKYYGIIGLCVIVLMQLIALMKIPFANYWITPIGWFGYIIFIDWLVYRRKRRSLMMSRRREFILTFPLSIGLWCVFELHNLLFRNWEYILPDSLIIILIGQGLSFATVLPAMLETYEFLESRDLFKITVKPQLYRKGVLIGEIVFGGALIATATFAPSIYTGPLIWPGYMFVFAPLNYLVGVPAVLKEREKGDASGIVNLMAAGYICGFVWEFLNYWAGAKWIYHMPLLEDVKIFEMPILGFLGFGPFAVALIEMYRFVAHFLKRSGKVRF